MRSRIYRRSSFPLRWRCVETFKDAKWWNEIGDDPLALIERGTGEWDGFLVWEIVP